MKNIAVLLSLVFSVFSIGCTQYVVLFSPPANLDPLPLKLSQVQKPEAATEQIPWNIAGVGLSDKSVDNPKLKGNVNIKVAILSTGIDYNHEDLVGQVAVNWKEVTEASSIKPSQNYVDDDNDGLVDNIVGWDVVDGDGLAYDRHGAGTAVAGIIAARVNGLGIRGVVDQVTLYPIRYINDNGQTDAPKLADALSYAAKAKPDVVFVQSADLPLGGARQDPNVMALERSLIDRQLKELANLGTPVVVGAGESLSEFETTSLGSTLMKHPNVIVVTSVNKDGNLALLANRGQKTVALGAPGDKVHTTLPGNKYGEIRGTAFAAAHVAGAIALAKAQYGDKMTLADHLMPAVIDPKSLKPNPAIEFVVRSGSVLDVPRFIEAIGERINN